MFGIITAVGRVNTDYLQQNSKVGMGELLVPTSIGMALGVEYWMLWHICSLDGLRCIQKPLQEHSSILKLFNSRVAMNLLDS